MVLFEAASAYPYLSKLCGLVMYLLFVLIFIELLCGAEVDLFVPSFPLIQEVYNLTPFKVELLMTVNLVGYAVSCIFVGPMGDKYGRREVILWGLCLFVFGSLFCSFAPTFELILLGRLFQGIGIAGPAVLAFVIVADLYSVEKQQTLLGLFNGLITIGMSTAPVLGSFITGYFGWRGNFNTLLIFGLLCTLLSFHALPKGTHNPSVSLSLTSYKEVLFSSKVLLYCLLILGLGCGYWVFISLSPVFYMEDLHVPLERFGYFQGAPALVFAVISFSSPYFYRLLGHRACFIGASVVSLAVLICYLYMSWINVDSPYVITAVICVVSGAVIFPINVFYPVLLDLIPGAKARISSFIMALRLVITAFLIQGISFFYDGTFAPIGLGLAMCLVGAFWAIKKLWPMPFPKTHP